MDKTSEFSILVIGQGYVGLPLAVLLSEVGHSVTGVDTDGSRAELLRNGVSPVSDISNARLEAVLRSGKFQVREGYDSVPDFDFAIITVPTPLREGSPDLSYIESAAKSLSEILTPGSTVILESTTYPGTTEELVVPILEASSDLKAGNDFFVGYSPERIDPGNPDWTLENTPKLVSGIDEASASKVEALYRSANIPTVRLSGTREAELSKLLENTFRHVNIALVNELAMFSRALGANIWESIEAAGTKPFGFMKFLPGPGVGGHCLPVDPSYLSWAVQNRTGSAFQFVDLANRINSQMPNYVVSRAQEILASSNVGISESRVVLLGLAYKPQSSDLRESPSLDVYKILQSLGADVTAIDPFVPDYLWPIELMRPLLHEDSSFDLAIVLTKHPGDSYSWALERSTHILDTREAAQLPNMHSL